MYKIVRTLREQQIPSPTGKPCWGIATLRGILTNPVYTGRVCIGRTQYRPAQVRWSATRPIGRPHASGTPLPPSAWQVVADVPAIITQEQFDSVQTKLAQNQAGARRNNTAHDYLVRALVSCSQCQYACTARTQGAYPYYVCTNKGNERRRRGAEACTAGLIPANQLDALIWQDLCAIVRQPEQITAMLGRANAGAWLPQELRARQETVRQAQRQLTKQLERLTEAYMQGVIPLAEYERRRHDTEQKIQSAQQQEAQITQQAQERQDLAAVASGATDFCARVVNGLEAATFTQKRQLVELLIDRVIVAEDKIEIRYVIPTGPAGEQQRFCQLRTDYFNAPNLIWCGCGDRAQQIRIDAMGSVALAQIGVRADAGDAHFAHTALDMLSVHAETIALQHDRDPP